MSIAHSYNHLPCTIADYHTSLVLGLVFTFRLADQSTKTNSLAISIAWANDCQRLRSVEGSSRNSRIAVSSSSLGVRP